MQPSVPACVVPTQIGKSIAGRFDHDLGDALALALGELVRFAEHAEDRHPVHARAAREFGELAAGSARRACRRP